MGLDLRIPLGLMFLAIAAILLGYGAFTQHSAIYTRSMGENVNLVWGAALALFGGLMLLLAWRGRRSPTGRRTDSAGTPNP